MTALSPSFWNSRVSPLFQSDAAVISCLGRAVQDAVGGKGCPRHAVQRCPVILSVLAFRRSQLVCIGAHRRSDN